jgi:hypothetical protein
MFVILVIIAGVALIVGAKDFAGKVLKGVLGVVLVLATLPCLLRECCCLVDRKGPTTGDTTGGEWVVLLFVALAVTGYIAWVRRSDSARAREIIARRHGSPRPRALPQPGQTHDQT